MLPAHVLVLDASEGIGAWAREALAAAGLAIALAKDATEAHRSIDAQRPALVLVPVVELAGWVPVLDRLDRGPTSVPLLGVVGRDATVDLTPALAHGLGDLVAFPCTPGELAARVTASMRGPEPAAPSSEPASPLGAVRNAVAAASSALVHTGTAATRSGVAELRGQLERAHDAVAGSLELILGAMIGNAEASGAGRTGHARRVSALAGELAVTLGWPTERVHGMRLAGLLQDVGMIAVPGDLLGVHGPLSPAARHLLHMHPDTTADVLEPLGRAGLPIPALRAHHERLDGSGYPRGLRGRQVPLAAQVLAVADTYVALTCPRPHRPALPPDAALTVLRGEAAAGRLPGALVATLADLVGAGVARPPSPRRLSPVR